jgi:hypothetical protein
MGDLPGEERGVGLFEGMERGSKGRAGERALSVKLGAISKEGEDG